MASLLAILQETFSRAINKSLGIDTKADLTSSTQEHFGHYQCNSALKLAKELKKNPRVVAQQIIDCVDLNDSHHQPMIKKLEIAGPGFINITLDASFLGKQADMQLRDTHLLVSLPDKPQKIIVEFSSPNVAKELHVGHLRSTIIGDCLARVLEYLGHDVLRLNHVGDWGTQFGMLIAFMKEHKAHVLSDEEDATLADLMSWYKQAREHFDADPSFKKRSQLEVVSLQGGDALSLKAWKKICEISRLAYQQIYDLLDIKLIERGESFYNPFLQTVVDDLEKKNLLVDSDGAKCVFLEGFTTREGTPLPLIAQKADGGFNYATTDMAALLHRVKEEKADRIIYVVDAGQSLHFQMLIAAAKKAGYYNEQEVSVEHVPFGVVLGTDGKKFKTRSGKTERLIDLLNEAISRAKKTLHEKMPDESLSEIEELAMILGLDAVKYADLSTHRMKDYLFSYDKMLRFEGNTAAFLLYAYVRIQGIKRKINKEISSVIKDNHITLEHKSEISLALHLRQFGETLELVARDLLPNRLSDYLFELAEKFHAFFRDCRVEGSDKECSRLLLCELTAHVLERGLNLLGLKTMQRM